MGDGIRFEPRRAMSLEGSTPSPSAECGSLTREAVATAILFLQTEFPQQEWERCQQMKKLHQAFTLEQWKAFAAGGPFNKQEGEPP